MVEAMMEQVMLEQQQSRASATMASKNSTDAILSITTESEGEVDIELAGLGIAHFDFAVQEREKTIHIRGKLVERHLGDEVRRPISILMTRANAAVLARQLAGELGITVVY